ncbi:methyl-accepting chemotaxis protein [Woodsholea maritima]|uniref:methyl-accepting chemotaxis protein n=1 Tax=Woodsholea maritima TaxID=240237 RepID=UPI0003629389|nr:nitrate- and nitrite sensing domain-containing protein [Woodsholea maritima]
MLSSISISWRIVVAVAVPALGLLIFGSMLTLNSFHDAQMTARVEGIASFSHRVGALVHELQKERGISAGFLGSGGSQDFTSRLEQQRRLTDEEISRFNTQVQSMNVNRFGADYAAGLDAAQRLLGTLASHRQRVDSVNISLDTSSSLYTEIIDTLFTTTLEGVEVVNDANLAKAFIAFFDLMNAKEMAGRERALGVNLFAAGLVTMDTHTRMESLQAKQEAYQQAFNHMAGAQWARRFGTAMSARSAGAMELDALRNEVRQAGYGGAFLDSSPQAWFDASTQRLDAMREFEGVFASYLAEQAAAREARLKTRAFQAALAAGAGALISITLSVFIILGVVGPIRAVTSNLDQLAQGQTDITIKGAERKDEIGQLSRAALVFLDATKEREEANQDKARLERQAISDRRRVLATMASEVEEATMSGVGEVTMIADDVSQRSQSMREVLAKAGKEAEDVSRHAKESVEKADRASSLASQIVEAISEVTVQISRSDELARSAVNQASESRSRVEELRDAARQIGDFVDLINELAEQTNLLALNATIEAARAGEAGKGFAVVASEVKALAAQTNKSTEEITARVQGIQDRTMGAVKAIEAISTSIDSLSEVTAAVAAAMEEQRTATASFTEFVTDTRNVVSEVAGQIASISQTTTEAAREADQMADAVVKMARTSEEASIAIPRIVQEATRKADQRVNRRYLSDILTKIECEDGKKSALIVELSVGGARMQGVNIPQGHALTFEVDNKMIEAQSMWTEGKSTGISFAEEALSERDVMRLTGKKEGEHIGANEDQARNQTVKAKTAPKAA